MESGRNRRLNIVSDDNEVNKLRAELHELREQCEQWQAVQFGILAGLALIVGMLIIGINGK